MNMTQTLDLNPLSKEFKLLLSFTGVQPDPAMDERLEDIDWKHFVELAIHHRVYPIVYLRMKEAGDGRIPAEAVQALQREYGKNAFQMLRLAAEMKRVCALFERHGIRALMLKGPVLADALYGDLSLRTCKDLDILVPLEDVEKAERLLLEAGYAPDHDEVRVLQDWKWRVHHSSYQHSGSRVQIELHWRLNPDRGKEPSFDELWERRNVRPIAAYRFSTLGNEDLFFFLVSHGARHGWFRLRWLADIDRLAGMMTDWESASRMMRKHHSGQMGGQALLLAAQLLRMPIEAGMKPLTDESSALRLAQGAIVFMKDMITLSPVPKELDIHYRKYLFSLRSMPQKWYLMVSLLYPNNRDIETLPLPKKLYMLYFPLRPFLWFWRRMRHQAPS